MSKANKQNIQKENTLSKEVKKQMTNWEQIFSASITDKRLISLHSNHLLKVKEK